MKLVAAMNSNRCTPSIRHVYSYPLLAFIVFFLHEIKAAFPVLTVFHKTCRHVWGLLGFCQSLCLLPDYISARCPATSLPIHNSVVPLPCDAVWCDVVTGVKILTTFFNSLNAELNPICYLLALLGAHHFLHVSRVRVKSLTLKLLMSYIYAVPILDVSRSHTTTHHSR